MRILHVVHDFLPHHVAGVEVYTDHVTRTLCEEHEITIVTSEVVPEAPNYSVRRARRGEVALYEIVNNHRFRDFAETYRNEAIDRAFRGILDEVQPDVAHVQHLLNLSIGLVDELALRRIPTLMTLHDHWLECANGGQRFHPELGRCAVLDGRRCGACTAHMHGIGLGLRGRLRRAAIEAREPEVLDLTALRPRIRTREAEFVYRDRYPLGGTPCATWVAHPPSRLRFALRLRAPGTFRAAVAMHPDTHEAEGGGVRFRVELDGAPVAERVLDPKRRPEDRDPAPLEVGLGHGRRDLELVTEAVPAERGDFCTAGWIAPRIVGGAPAGRALSTAARAALGSARRLAARLTAQGQARRIERRWAAMRGMAQKVDVFVAPSRYLGDELARFGIPRERILYSDYGFVTERFTPRSDLPQRARHFAYLGSLVPHKGVHVLIEAFNGMPPDAQLQVFGARHYHPVYWERLRRSARHPGVHFAGALAPESVPAALREADALVVSSIWCENSPLTIHEAFLAGVPVVASRLGGNVDLLAQGGGLLYEATDPAALRSALRRLYDEPGLARRLAATAPRVKPMAEHADELIALYRRLQGSRGGKGCSA
jgi:glycosyltransferase involved in cell wall biosynthesis